MDDGRISPGQVLWGRYKIDKLLGEGGMGQVWAAADAKLKRPVAIKIIRRRYADHPEYAARFRREAQAVAGLKHRNIVQVHDADEAADGRLFMVMEWIPGISVRELIDTSKRIDMVTAVHIAIQVAAALGAAHTVGIWHRDIKPENIMVSTDGSVWVLDFGIAVQSRSPGERAMIQRGRRRGTGRLGTVAYTPPEEAQNQTADQRGDFYQLGIVLYEMIAGRKPYPDVDEQNATEMLAAHVFSDPRPLMEIVPDCPEWIWPIVTRLLAKDPDERYDDEEELIDHLRAGLSEPVPPGHPFARKIDQDRHEQARKEAFAKRGSLNSIPGESAALAEARLPEEAEPILGGWASTGPVAGEPAASRASPTNATKELSPGPVPSSAHTPRWLEVTGPLPDTVPSAAPWSPPYVLSPPAVPPPQSSLLVAMPAPSTPVHNGGSTPKPPGSAPMPSALASQQVTGPLPENFVPSSPSLAVAGPLSPGPYPPISPDFGEKWAGGTATATVTATSAVPLPAGEAGRVELARAELRTSPLLRALVLRARTKMPPARLLLPGLAMGIALAVVLVVVLRPRPATPPAWEDGVPVAGASGSPPVPPTTTAAAVSTPTAEPPPPVAALSTATPLPKPAPQPAKSAPSVPTGMSDGKPVPAKRVRRVGDEPPGGREPWF